MSAPERIWAWPHKEQEFGWRLGYVSVEANVPLAAIEYTRTDLAPTLTQALAVPEIAALVEACRAWGMHIEPDEITADDPFREIRAALAAPSTPPTDGDKA